MSRVTSRQGAAFALLSVAVWAGVLRPWHWYMEDLIVYRTGGHSLIHHQNLYTVVSGSAHLHFTYPPFASVVMVPLAVVPLGWAKALLTIATGICLWISLAAYADQISAESRRLAVATVPAAFAIAIWLEPVRSTFSFGQINSVLMALIVVDLFALRNRRYSGVLLGIAAAIKLTPLAFVPYLLVVRRYRQAGCAVAGFAGCALLGVAVDPSASRTYWWGHRFLSAHRIGRVENASNQSVRGILARALKTQTVPWYWILVAAFVLVLALALARALYQAGLESRAVAVMAMGMLIASPISWSHHWIWCAIMPLVLYDLARFPEHRRFVVVAGIVVLLPFALGLVFWAPHTDHLELRESVLQELLSATYVLAGVVFAWLLAVELRWRRGLDRGPLPLSSER